MQDIFDIRADIVMQIGGMDFALKEGSKIKT